ncbi:MAG: PEPxxWA-CTERM sorting domain-containing protein [Pseudomonadota bacterium]
MFPRFTTLALGALAAATIASAPAHATIIFQQDFSGGLKANEKLTGNFGVGNGKMGHTAGFYANNERSFYDLTVDLTGVTDALFSFDWTQSSESGWDGWNLLVAEAGATFNGTPYPGSPAIYNKNVGALYGAGVSGNNAGRAVFNLQPFVGKVATLRIQFASDGGLAGAGALFDNVVVSGTPIATSAAPEPATWGLMILGFMGAGGMLRRRGPVLA